MAKSLTFEMNEGNITITITESQHELLNDILNHSLEAMNLIMPYGDGFYDLPHDSPIVQRYTMIENMREMFYQLWSDRFSDVTPD
jgi:hypothetical protein